MGWVEGHDLKELFLQRHDLWPRRVQNSTSCICCSNVFGHWCHARLSLKLQIGLLWRNLWKALIFPESSSHHQYWTDSFAVFCTGNCYWSGYVLTGHPGTIWMDSGPLGGLQEARVVDSWITSELLLMIMFHCRAQRNVASPLTCILLPPSVWLNVKEPLHKQCLISLLRNKLQNKCIHDKQHIHCFCSFSPKWVKYTCVMFLYSTEIISRNIQKAEFGCVETFSV